MSEKLRAKPDICICKRSLFTKILPGNASLSTAAIKQGSCSPMLLARTLPGCCLGQHLHGDRGLQRLTRGMGRAGLHPRQGAGQLGTAAFNQESRSSGTSVVVRWFQGQARKSVHRTGSRGTMAGHSAGGTGDRHPNITAQMEV